MNIDEIDRRILQVLEEDPRVSNKKISEIVGLTPQAVGIRIKKLRDAQVIGGIKILKPLPRPSKIIKKVERFQTKIPGFDRHIGGGIPNFSTILLIGEWGVGTTTFCLRLLWTALNEKLKCTFFAIERPSEQFIHQLKSFGWNPNKSENIQFIDVFNIINRNINEFESISHIDILQIYHEMIEHQRNLMPRSEILIFDSFTELINLVKGSSIEFELINQLGTNIMKHKSDLICFYVLKSHIIPANSMHTLKSYADCVINFRKEIQNQQIHRYLLIEKMLYTDHTKSEIEFHITNQGIILNEYMLHYKALQNPPLGKDVALFHIQELDYLTQGLPYGTFWILEIDSLFPLSDILKLYVNFFVDGLARQETCLFVFPKVSLNLLIKLFKQAIHNNKNLQKENFTLEEIINQRQLFLYDIFQKSLILENKSDLTYFKPINWSSVLEKNLEYFGNELIEQKSNHTYIGYNISDLTEIPLKKEQIIKLHESLIQIIQKRESILLATINPSLHSPEFVNKLRYDSDGIIRLWIGSEPRDIQNKYVQIIKTPQGNRSLPHLLNLIDKPPYFQLI